MQLEPLANLHWAFQLHYLLCFRTNRRRSFFAGNERMAFLSNQLIDICSHHDYHLLEAEANPDHLRCLLSLRPNHVISKVIQTVKTNLSRESCVALALTAPVWERGYLARTVGRVRIGAVRKYLDSQSEHHGYASRLRPAVFRYVAREPLSLKAAHAAFELNHHLVLATRFRRAIFDSRIGSELSAYWMRVAEKRGFAIDRMSILPDHVHLMVRTVPKTSIEDCALALMNNAQHWMAQRFAPVLVKEKVDRLWQSSAYAGTCGEVTTALVKWFLHKTD
jgi:REP-associated tyrosine transposase